MTYLKAPQPAFGIIAFLLGSLIAILAKKGADAMQYVQLYADSAGETHFRPAAIELDEADYRPPAPLMFVSHAYPTNALQFVRLPPGWAGQDIHPPQQQFLLCLEGQLEVTASDGEKRTFGPGAALLMDDTTGKGHRSYVKGPQDWVAAIVPLE